MFEVVHTLTVWYDGPRRGIADYLGSPHSFEAEWNDDNDLADDTYFLMSIDSHTFSLACEDWAIWRRWETAFHQGRTTRDSHPALPDDRARHEEIESLLEGRLQIDPSVAIRKKGEFRVRSDPDWSGYGWQPLEVKWSDI